MVTGILLILVAILAFLRFGWLGNQTANLLRLLVGDSYLLLAGAMMSRLRLTLLRFQLTLIRLILPLPFMMQRLVVRTLVR